MRAVAWSLMSEEDYDTYLQERGEMLTPVKVIYHQDSEHGWFAVPLGMLSSLGIDTSRYSYVDHASSTVYLEEDCDATAFVQACEREDIVLDIEERHIDGDHWIRSLPRFGTGEAWA